MQGIFKAVREALVAGHLSSRVAAQSLLLSRARSAYLSSLKAGA